MYDGSGYLQTAHAPMAAGSCKLTLPADLQPGSDYQVSLFWEGCGRDIFDASGLFFVSPPGAQPGDFDDDGDVDRDDMAVFEACGSGPGVPLIDPACLPADLDGDHDVDQSDFGTIQRCFNGAARPGEPDCAR
jgi:hypothetical protein